MQRLGHPRLVRVPEQQVEGFGLLAQQVVVHEERPDQVVGAQGVEGVGHGLAGKDSATGVHLLFDVADPVLVGEQQQVARLGEVLLSGEEGGGVDPLVPLCGHEGEGAGQQGAADAVADGVDLIDAALGHHRLAAGVDAVDHVVFEGPGRHRRVRIDPGGHEHREALAGQPADHRVLLAQVEDVIFVDPGREDQQRDLVDLVGRWGELQDLDQLVLEDHLARSGGDVVADLEWREVGLADRQLAAAAGEIAGEILHAPHQALALGGGHFSQRRRVRHQEVGRGEGVGEHLHEELDPAFGQRVHPIDLGDQVVQPVRGEQVGLLHHVEDGIGAPVGVVEPLVALGGCDHGLGLLAGHPPCGGAPEVEISAEEVSLGPHHPVGLGGEAAHDLVEGRGDMERVGAECGRAVRLAQRRVGDGALGGEGGPGKIGGQCLHRLSLGRG